MPRPRNPLLAIALCWLAFTLVVAVVIGVYAESPDRPVYGEWTESVIGPMLYLWGFYGVLPSVLLFVVALFLRAFRLRDRRAA